MIMTVARNLRKHRILKGLTQFDVYYSSGIAPKQLSDYELGKVDTNISTLSALAKAYGITMSQLFEEEIDKQ